MDGQQSGVNRPISRPQLSDEIARFIRTAIFSGRYKPGEYIRLDTLATELGVSVTPVREALFHLRSEGFVDRQAGRGFKVIGATERDILDVLDVLGHVGGELAARAAENFTPESLAALEEIHIRFLAAQAGDDDELAAVNFEFHRAINLAADSPRLARIMSSTSRLSPETVSPRIEGWPGRAISDHQAILDAMKAGDPDRARQAMSSHFSAPSKGFTEYLARVGAITARP